MVLNHQLPKDTMLLHPAMTKESKIILSKAVTFLASVKVNKWLYENLFFTYDFVI